MKNNALAAFKEYLQEKSYRPNTVNGHVMNVGYFMEWIKKMVYRK